MMAIAPHNRHTSPPSTPLAANVETTTEWRGTSSGNFQTAANWTNGAPVAGGTLIFNSGSVNVDAGLSNTSLNLAAVYFHPDWTGKIDGTLALASIEKLRINKRVGTLAISGKITTARIYNTAGDTTAVTLTATGAQKITNLHLHGTRGAVAIGASSNVTVINGYPTKGRRAQLTIGASATIGTIRQGPNCYITSGSGAFIATANGNGVLTFTAGTVTTLKAANNGQIDYRSSGTVTALTLQQGGAITLRENESTAVTFTDMEMHKGSRADLASGIQSATVTNGITYYGGELIPDQGTTVTIS